VGRLERERRKPKGWVQGGGDESFLREQVLVRREEELEVGWVKEEECIQVLSERVFER